MVIVSFCTNHLLWHYPRHFLCFHHLTEQGDNSMLNTVDFNVSPSQCHNGYISGLCLLEPLFFIIYSNGTSTTLKCRKMYADDLKHLLLSSLLMMLMSFSKEIAVKCKKVFCVFILQYSSSNCFDYCIRGSNLSCPDNIKNIGVIFDKSLISLSCY